MPATAAREWLSQCVIVCAASRLDAQCVGACMLAVPKASNKSLVHTEVFEILTRTAIAYSYALGGHTVVPW